MNIFFVFFRANFDCNFSIALNFIFLIVIQKIDLPLEIELHLTDDSGTEVDADVFEELLQAGNLTVRVATERSRGETQTC